MVTYTIKVILYFVKPGLVESLSSLVTYVNNYWDLLQVAMYNDISL